MGDGMSAYDPVFQTFFSFFAPYMTLGMFPTCSFLFFLTVLDLFLFLCIPTTHLVPSDHLPVKSLSPILTSATAALSLFR
jgi:hypothetical protein